MYAQVFILASKDIYNNYINLQFDKSEFYPLNTLEGGYSIFYGQLYEEGNPIAFARKSILAGIKQEAGIREHKEIILFTGVKTANGFEFSFEIYTQVSNFKVKHKEDIIKFILKNWRDNKLDYIDEEKTNELETNQLETNQYFESLESSFLSSIKVSFIRADRYLEN